MRTNTRQPITVTCSFIFMRAYDSNHHVKRRLLAQRFLVCCYIEVIVACMILGSSCSYPLVLLMNLVYAIRTCRARRLCNETNTSEEFNVNSTVPGACVQRDTDKFKNSDSLDSYHVWGFSLEVSPTWRSLPYRDLHCGAAHSVLRLRLWISSLSNF